ncbi:MAG: hypothetical protein NTZ09_08620 [Candidatus Hydrogenedentes bacterium]|nr:hypothetical protein [Candidatus Hydrogenedentota bacterium]
MEGSLTEAASAAQLDPTSGNEFMIRDSAADEIFRSDSSGNMYIKGSLYERVGADLDAVTVQSLRVKDSTGDTVALVNSQSFTNSGIEPTWPYTVPAGSVILPGRAFVGADPDRDSSQGV